MDHQHLFPHHTLDAWHVAVELADRGKALADRVPRGYRSLADQLLRASMNAALLLAEGANRWTAGQKRQRFQEARGECGEVAAALELGARMGLLPDAEVAQAMKLAGRLGAMLTRLVQRHR